MVAKTEVYSDELIPVSEAVKFLSPKIPGVDITHLLSDLRRGRNRSCEYIPYERIGGRVYYRRTHLLALADSRERKVQPPSIVKKFGFDEVPGIHVDPNPVGVGKVVISHNMERITLRANDAIKFADSLKARSRSVLFKSRWGKLLRP